MLAGAEADVTLNLSIGTQYHAGQGQPEKQASKKPNLSIVFIEFPFSKCGGKEMGQRVQWESTGGLCETWGASVWRAAGSRCLLKVSVLCASFGISK